VNNTSICQNGGECYIHPTTRAETCRCGFEAYGTRCEFKYDDCVNNTQCGANGVCVDESRSLDGIPAFSCECNAGWTGSLCVDVLEAAPVNEDLLPAGSALTEVDSGVPYDRYLQNPTSFIETLQTIYATASNVEVERIQILSVAPVNGTDNSTTAGSRRLLQTAQLGALTVLARVNFAILPCFNGTQANCTQPQLALTTFVGCVQDNLGSQSRCFNNSRLNSTVIQQVLGINITQVAAALGEVVRAQLTCGWGLIRDVFGNCVAFCTQNALSTTNANLPIWYVPEYAIHIPLQRTLAVNLGQVWQSAGAPRQLTPLRRAPSLPLTVPAFTFEISRPTLGFYDDHWKPDGPFVSLAAPATYALAGSSPRIELTTGFKYDFVLPRPYPAFVQVAAWVYVDNTTQTTNLFSIGGLTVQYTHSIPRYGRILPVFRTLDARGNVFRARPDSEWTSQPNAQNGMWHLVSLSFVKTNLGLAENEYSFVALGQLVSTGLSWFSSHRSNVGNQIFASDFQRYPLHVYSNADGTQTCTEATVNRTRCARMSNLFMWYTNNEADYVWNGTAYDPIFFLRGLQTITRNIRDPTPTTRLRCIGGPLSGSNVAFGSPCALRYGDNCQWGQCFADQWGSLTDGVVQYEDSWRCACANGFVGPMCDQFVGEPPTLDPVRSAQQLIEALVNASPPPSNNTVYVETSSGASWTDGATIGLSVGLGGGVILALLARVLYVQWKKAGGGAAYDPLAVPVAPRA
jgi:hypothetical protein